MGELNALIDTSLLIPPGRATGPDFEGGWAVSVISVGELEAGVLLAGDPAARADRLRRLTAILAEAPILGVDRTVAARFGELRAASGRSATNDLWIAATALAHGLALFTGDQAQAALPLVRTTLVD